MSPVTVKSGQPPSRGFTLTRKRILCIIQLSGARLCQIILGPLGPMYRQLKLGKSLKASDIILAFFIFCFLSFSHFRLTPMSPAVLHLFINKS